MAKIGSWWLAKHEGFEGEVVLWSCLANFFQSHDRAVGGVLYLTNQRLLFSPHLIDYFNGGFKWSIQRSEIYSVEKQPKGGDTLYDGFRDRLRIELENGECAQFIVNKLDKVIETLNQALRQ